MNPRIELLMANREPFIEYPKKEMSLKSWPKAMTYEELQDRWFEAYPVEGDQEIPTDVYSKFYVDRMIDHFKIKIISFFRDSKNCRGLDIKSLLGQIADTAFKHWRQVEKNTRKFI